MYFPTKDGKISIMSFNLFYSVLFYFILFDRHRDTERSCHLVIYFPNAFQGWDWAKGKATRQTSIQISQVGGRDPVIELSPADFRDDHQQEAGVSSQG